MPKPQAPEKVRERVRRWTRANPDKKKARNLKRVGWTPERLEAFFTAQEGRCGICRVPLNRESHKDDSVSCDHDHQTLRPRGLLCNRCNRIEGHLAKSHLSPEEWVSALRAYLTKHTGS